MSRLSAFFKKNHNIAFTAAFIAGLIIHIFGLVNTIHNYDDIAVLPAGFGSSINSGRWLLAALGGAFHLLFGSYNLPFFNGVLFLLIIAVCAGYLTVIFDVKSPKIAVLLGLILAAFPGTTTTLFFKYTAPYYGIAILLSILAAKVLLESTRQRGFILAAVLTALALGIYQAYLPITVSILVISLLKKALNDENVSFKNIFFRGIYYCLSILVGILLYKVIVDASIYLCNVFADIIYAQAPDATVTKFALSDYQGINNMGNLSLTALPLLIWNTFKALILLPIQDHHGFAQTILLRAVYTVLGIITVFFITVMLCRKKRKAGNIIAVIMLCILYPIAINLIEVMCPDGFIYTLMVYSFFLVPCTPLLLAETFHSICGAPPKIQTLLKKGVAVAVLVMVFAYAHQANVNYSHMYYTTRQTENYMSSLVTQVRMTEGFDTDKKWAFVGDITDPLLNSRWKKVPTYGGNVRINNLLNQYSRNNWIENYVGYSVSFASTEEIAKLKQTDTFKEMPCWPDEGSIKVIGDTVVVKFEK